MLQPAGIRDTVGHAGSVAAPAAGAVIATVTIPGGGGNYTVELDTWQAGTPDALFTNMELRVGSRVITKLPSGALVAPTSVRRVTAAAGETTITVNATAIGTGTYIATLQATQVG